MKWGDVPKEDLAMTVYEQDPNAEAVVLGNYVDIFFIINAKGSITVEYRYHKRIKILKEEGFDRANIKLYHYDSEEINTLNAQVINSVGGKPKKTKLSKDQFFKERKDDDYNTVSFAFPEIKVGSVIEYKYTFKDENPLVLEPWYFQEDIPTKWSEFRVVVPEGFEYTIIKGGTLPFFIDDASKDAQNVGASVTKTQVQTVHGTITRTNKSSQTGSDLRGTSYRKVVKDAPAMVDQDFITTMNDYYTKIEYQLKSTYLNSRKRSYYTTWDAVASELRTRDKFGVQVKNYISNKKITDLVPAKIAGSTGEKEIAAKVYSLVSNAIKWNGRYGIVANETVNKAASLALGNGAVINLGLVASLNKAGIKADPVLISTRSHGKPQPLYPILSQFNHVIAVATIDGKQVFMDAINANRPFDILATNDLNGQGLLVSMKEGGPTKWVNITPAKGIVNSNLTLEAKDGVFNGHVVNSHMGYAAVDARASYHNSSEEDYLKSCLGEELEYTIEEANFKGHKSNSNRFVEDLRVTFDMTLSDKIYLTPIMLSSFTENSLKLKERNYPVDIAYPIAKTYSCKFIIPEGYEVVEIPESIKIKIPDGTASYHFFVEQADNAINVLSKLKLTKTIYSPDEYLPLKQLFEQVIQKQQEQIVLKKS